MKANRLKALSAASFFAAAWTAAAAQSPQRVRIEQRVAIEYEYALDGGAPSEARRFLRGASPRRARTSHPLVPSVGTMEEESNPNEVV